MYPCYDGHPPDKAQAPGCAPPRVVHRPSEHPWAVPPPIIALLPLGASRYGLADSDAFGSAYFESFAMAKQKLGPGATWMMSFTVGGKSSCPNQLLPHPTIVPSRLTANELSLLVET